ncbi:MAG TPA: hypothetical protein VG992_03170 [Candidatus Saccharimonadales bacterium]|nr:hypothetical protein [Candidatus Saccharimonadales bacterium]
MNDMERPEPYVGVSGIGHFEEQLAIGDMALKLGMLTSEHFVMIGVQATGKSQVQEIENSRGRAWHPVGDELKDAAVTDDSGITRGFVHCFFEDDELEVGLERVMERSSGYLQGLQLNKLPWMDNDYRPILHDLKHQQRDVAVVLQAHSDILDWYRPHEVVRRLGTLPVDYVLFDASEGAGRLMNPGRLRRYVDELYQAQLPIGAVVAGGLEASNLDDYFGPLLAEFDDLSCDAEGRIRSGPEGNTRLDFDKVRNYLTAWKTIQDS